ncbi:hypothetical protein V8C86DRAFT_2564482 [Haematococcus lacustris]
MDHRRFIHVKAADKKSKPFCGQIWYKGKRIYYTNYYSTPEEAARAVDRYIYKIKGPDASTNFPLDAAQRAELDGLSLDDVEAQFRKLGEVERDKVTVKVKGVSQYRGVCAKGRQGVWQSILKYNSVPIHLQVTEDEQEAALAWDSAVWYLRGTAIVTRLNFPHKFVTAEGKPRDDAPALPAAHLAKIKACLAKAGVPLAPNHRAEMTYKHAEGQVASQSVGVPELASEPQPPSMMMQGPVQPQSQLRHSRPLLKSEVEQGDPGCTLVAAATVGCNGQARAASGNDGHQRLLRPPGSALSDMSPASCELAVEPSSATDHSNDDDDDDGWSLASSSDGDDYCPGQASSQIECPNLIQVDALKGSPGHRPLARLLEGCGSNMAAWQDLESVTVAELMYHGAVAAEPDSQSVTLCTDDEHHEHCMGSLLLKRLRLEGQQAAPRVQAGPEQEAAAADVQSEVDACEQLLAAIRPPRVDSGGAWLPAQLSHSQQAVAVLTQQVTHAMAAQQSQTHSVGSALPPWSWPPTILALGHPGAPLPPSLLPPAPTPQHALLGKGPAAAGEEAMVVEGAAAAAAPACDPFTTLYTRGRKRQASPMPCSADSAALAESCGILAQPTGHAHAAEGCEGASVGEGAVRRVGGAGDQGSCGLPTAGTAPWSNIANYGPALWHRVEAALMHEISSTIDNEAVEQLMWLEFEGALVEALADKDPGFLEWGSWLKHEPLTGYVVSSEPLQAAAKQATLDAASRDARFVEGSPGYDPVLRLCFWRSYFGFFLAEAEELMARLASAHAAYPREASRG